MKKQYKSKKIDLTPTAKAMQTISMKDTVWDPFGSYTGVPKDENETPVQDADDL